MPLCTGWDQLTLASSSWCSVKFPAVWKNFFGTIGARSRTEASGRPVPGLADGPAALEVLPGRAAVQLDHRVAVDPPGPALVERHQFHMTKSTISGPGGKGRVRAGRPLAALHPEHPQLEGQRGVVADQGGELEHPGLAQLGHGRGVLPRRPGRRPGPASAPRGPRPARPGRPGPGSSPARTAASSASVSPARRPAASCACCSNALDQCAGHDQDGQLAGPAPAGVPWYRSAAPSACRAAPSARLEQHRVERPGQRADVIDQRERLLAAAPRPAGDGGVEPAAGLRYGMGVEVAAVAPSSGHSPAVAEQLRDLRAGVASTIGRSSRVIRAAGQSRDCTARFAPATTAPFSPRTGAATERRP